MERYVALLGSINVGGNRLLMADLRHALEREEFEDVETVVASGNVLFRHEERPSHGLADKFAYVLRDRFDIDSFAAVRTRDELAAAIDGNPFHGVGEDNLVHTLFLERQPSAQQFADLIDTYAGRGPEKLAPGTCALHVDYMTGVGTSKLTGAFIERKLGSRATARNMRSLKRILAKMDGATMDAETMDQAD
ncbi:DUF1697 domain-containing protein [Altererythrobacter sp. TH136]|uniref:DUF1697 domain-containing protein n=1 Tax=Altererythrobacter sp. TH136 TaxID=2067415 RepID=UPI001164E07B|nr:DUF1697 domain-containing protein [Altererythrobacter sp. TH136]QDM41427.1 DUF1697 domain-containing protein [Altererythrobacter sp. TH136]